MAQMLRHLGFLSLLGGRVKMDRKDFDLGSRFVTKLRNAGRFCLTRCQSHGERTSPQLNKDFATQQLDLLAVGWL